MNITPSVPRPPRLDRLVGIGLALASLILYILTLAPTVLDADAAEFQFVPWLPGIAHPTGYPLYVLLGWLWTHLLPVGEVAWRMNLLSAVLGAAAVGLVYALAGRLLDLVLPETPPLARILAAVIAAATFATGATFWSQAVIAEVYTLHALLVAAVLWLALKVDGAGWRGWPAPALAFTFGLGLAHHRTIVLLLPALVLFFLTRLSKPSNPQPPIPDPRSLTPDPRPPIPIFLLAAAPLLLYLALPLLAPRTPYATLNLSDSQTLILYENSLPGFWRHVTGAVFAGAVQPAAAGPERLALAWGLLRQQVGLVGAGLALAGLILLGNRRQLRLLGLTGLSALAFLLFNLVYFIGDVFVLFIPVWLLVVLWLSLGVLGLAHTLAANFVKRRGSPEDVVIFKALGDRLTRRIYQILLVFLVIVFLVLPGILFTTRIPLVSQAGNRTAQVRAREILAEPLPAGAILLSNDRNELMPLWYYQYVEARRPDLLGLFPLIVPEPAYANVGRLLDQALASGRPVYLIKPMDGLSLKANLVPAGRLVRATPYPPPPAGSPVTLPPATISLPDNRQVTETIKLIGHELTSGEITPGAVMTVTLYWQPVQPLTVDYTSYVHLVDPNGQGLAQSDHRPGDVYYPSRLWQPGEILRDRHVLTLPPDLPPGEYRLRTGLYYQPQPGIIAGMGAGVELGRLTVVAPVSMPPR